METIRYELKYCERCGTLKLRQVASASTYCRRCEGLLARFSRRRHRLGSGCWPESQLTVVSDRLPGRVQ